METVKPERRTNIFDYWNPNKKTKIKEEIEPTPKKSITHLEDLSNELFYEIFNYLDDYHVYKAFYHLNIRLQSLLTNSTLSLKINISSMSKSNFQRYNRHIITPNKDRIMSLYVSNPFVIDSIFSPVRSALTFTRLETLIFDNIKPKYLFNILHHLASLPCLSSLVLNALSNFKDLNQLYLTIFHLPVLKYFKISLEEAFEYEPLPIVTNLTSSIEHLVIYGNVYLSHFNTLLIYIPNVRRLSINCLIQTNDAQPIVNFNKLNHLKHVCFNTMAMDFDRFETMSRSLFNQVEVLRISIDNGRDRTYLNANRWEHLIVSSIPQLRIFDFEHKNYADNDLDNDQLIYDSVVNQFSSPFWIERKWFFAYRFYFEEYGRNVSFYSIHQNKRNEYTLYKPLIRTNLLRHQRTNVNFINHVNVQSEETMTTCSHYFHNATKLTLSDRFLRNGVRLAVTLKHIIPLKQLSILVINGRDFSIEQLIRLLTFIPNIHRLELSCQLTIQPNSLIIQQTEMFRLVSNTNTIRTVTITERYSTENLKIFVNLCPRMQYLTIDPDPSDFESSVQHILSKTKTTFEQLCLLCVKSASKSMSGKLKSMIESEELLDNYVLKLIGSDLYFWW